MISVCFLSEWSNVALNKPVTQSSQKSSGTGGVETIVDGSLKSYQTQLCSHTSGPTEDANPWWRVDLQKAYDIYAVIITNFCCGQSTSIQILRDLFYIQSYDTIDIQIETRLKMVKGSA